MACPKIGKAMLLAAWGCRENVGKKTTKRGKGRRKEKSSKECLFLREEAEEQEYSVNHKEKKKQRRRINEQAIRRT